jgi:sugar phosphate isomerase/epimerase
LAVCLGIEQGTSPGRADGGDGIAAMLPHARASGVKLAIEPLHPMYAADRACVNTIDQALDICEAAG